jgi:capsular polysaccharide transport system ATP-binding protein
VSIVLDNVRVGGEAGDKPLFEGLSLQIADKSRMGILGTSKPANATLLRLICRTKQPDEGIVRSDVRVSWPIPLSAFLVGGHTLARNVRFIARLYGISDEDFPRRVVDSVELGEFLNKPLSACPRTAKGRLAFALGVGLDFDMYLFDGSFTPVDKPFKEKAAQITAARTAGRGFLIATNMPAEVEQNCESVYVLENGRATYYPRASEGIEHFTQLLAMEKKKQQRQGEKPGVEDDGEPLEEDVGMIGLAAVSIVED